eukprot:1220974-Pyramimonas_sp.AAC.1
MHEAPYWMSIAEITCVLHEFGITDIPVVSREALMSDPHDEESYTKLWMDGSVSAVIYCSGLHMVPAFNPAFPWAGKLEEAGIQDCNSSREAKHVRAAWPGSI